MDKTYYVYILASKRNGTLYIGVTNNLERRMYEHKNKLIDGFAKKYNVDWQFTIKDAKIKLHKLYPSFEA